MLLLHESQSTKILMALMMLCGSSNLLCHPLLELMRLLRRSAKPLYLLDAGLTMPPKQIQSTSFCLFCSLHVTSEVATATLFRT